MRSVSLLYVLENKFDILFQHGTIRAKVLQMVDSSQEWQMEFRETQDGASEEHVTPELVRGACDTRGDKETILLDDVSPILLRTPCLHCSMKITIENKPVEYRFMFISCIYTFSFHS